MHSASWNEGIKLKGRTVAVLGCGSSGVQIVPTIQKGNASPTLLVTPPNNDAEVKSLVTFIRTPTWITSGFAQSKAGPNGSNFACKFGVATLLQRILYAKNA